MLKQIEGCQGQTFTKLARNTSYIIFILIIFSSLNKNLITEFKKSNCGVFTVVDAESNISKTV